MARAAITQALIAQGPIAQALAYALLLKLMLLMIDIAPLLLLKALLKPLVPKL